MPRFLEQNLAKGKLPEKAKEAAQRENILASLESAGLKEPVHKEVIDRLFLLEDNSKFNQDSRQIAGGLVKVLDFLAERQADQYPQLRLTAERKNDGRVASILHDIGKAGPADATREQQEAVIKLFAIEGIKNTERLVGKIAAENFSADEAKKLLSNLAACLVRPEMTMKQFWNRHANWTHDILEKYPDGLNEHVRIIAGSHHIDNGVNPYNLSGQAVSLSPEIIKTSGDEIDDLEERVLIVIDKYQALIRRGQVTHEAAMAWVRHNLAKYKKDDLLKLIIDVVDELGRQNKIFS